MELERPSSSNRLTSFGRRIDPLIMSFSPRRERRRAVFPDPVGPLMMVRAPAGKMKSMSPSSKTRGGSVDSSTVVARPGVPFVLTLECFPSSFSAVPEFHLKRAPTKPIRVSMGVEVETGREADLRDETATGTSSSSKKASIRRQAIVTWESWTTNSGRLENANGRRVKCRSSRRGRECSTYLFRGSPEEGER